MRVRALIAMLIMMRPFVLAIMTVIAALMHVAALVVSVVEALVVLLVLIAGVLLHLVQLLVEVDQMVYLIHQLQRQALDSGRFRAMHHQCLSRLIQRTLRSETSD